MYCNQENPDHPGSRCPRKPEAVFVDSEDSEAERQRTPPPISESDFESQCAADQARQRAEAIRRELEEQLRDPADVASEHLGEAIGALPVFDLNTASKADLMTLSGVGSVLAQRIVDYRRTRRFERPSDLRNITGIGKNMYAKIAHRLKVVQTVPIEVPAAEASDSSGPAPLIDSSSSSAAGAGEAGVTEATSSSSS